MKLPKCADGEAIALDSKGVVQRGMDLPQTEIRERTAFLAAVEYAKSSRDGLDQAGLDLPTTKGILQILVKHDMPARGILDRITSSGFMEELLPELPKMVPKEALREYYTLLVDGPEPLGFEELRECDSFNALRAALVDDFWERQVTFWLGLGHFRLCWAEIKKAGYQDPPLAVVERLIDILYSALCKSGCLHEISYDAVEIRGRHRRMAGFGFACKFCTQEKGTYRFGRTGQMILTLARYFSQRRTVKRTARIRRSQVDFRSSFVH